MSDKRYTLNIKEINIDASKVPYEKVIADLVRFAYYEMLKMHKNYKESILNNSVTNSSVNDSRPKVNINKNPKKNIYDFLYEIYSKYTKGKYDAGVATATLKAVAKSQGMTSKAFKEEYENGEITASFDELTKRIDICSAVGKFHMEEAARTANARIAKEAKEDAQNPGLFSTAWSAVNDLFDNNKNTQNKQDNKKIIPENKWQQGIDYAIENNLPYCNLYTGKELAKEGIYFPYDYANTQRDYLEESGNWIDIGLDHDKAFELASNGKKVIASYEDDTKEHGHIGFVDANNEMKFSESYDTYTPHIKTYAGNGEVKSKIFEKHFDKDKENKIKYFYYNE